MLINLWPGNSKTQLNTLNLKVGEENGKSMAIGNGRYQNVCQSSSNAFWKNLVVKSVCSARESG